jgi:predicted RNA binding protein YcfA (HicA-like mRNA interferase family)
VVHVVEPGQVNAEHRFVEEEEGAQRLVLRRRGPLTIHFYADRILTITAFQPPKVSEILKLLSDDGWYIVTMRGSHRQLKHPNRLGRVTVHGKPSDDIAPGTLNSILKQAGLKK